jgi:sulfonate transport system substrate-binding protein
MAAAEVESGATLFHRNAAANTWGVLNVTEAFAKENPALVSRVLKAYEEARAYSLANRDELKKTLVSYTKLPETVIERQLERTELTHSTIGQAGVINAGTDVKAAVDSLIDRSFATAAR